MNTLIVSVAALGERLRWEHGEHSGTITFPGDERGPVDIQWDYDPPDDWEAIEALVEAAASESSALGRGELSQDVFQQLVRYIVDKMKRCDLGNKRVLASTQYGMGYILTQDNEIVFRDDAMSHERRELIAEAVNEVMLPNVCPPVTDVQPETGGEASAPGLPVGALFCPNGPLATPEAFGATLARHDIIQAQAVEDPEGYDGGETQRRVALLWGEITSHLQARAAESLREVEAVLERMQSGANDLVSKPSSTET
jgi:hypothetical protein